MGAVAGECIGVELLATVPRLLSSKRYASLVDKSNDCLSGGWDNLACMWCLCTMDHRGWWNNLAQLHCPKVCSQLNSFFTGPCESQSQAQSYEERQRSEEERQLSAPCFVFIRTCTAIS